MEELLRERLGLIEHWLRGMVRQDTGQFAYLYQPEADRVEGNSPTRDIATVWDAELLARFLGSDELDLLLFELLQELIFYKDSEGGGRFQKAEAI
ncbi:MAG: hypothetical protein HY900_11240 [Deltaproteobacteria bacterium]|nr:hypothetical protein [Deltaproteobacteria bacterium]